MGWGNEYRSILVFVMMLDMVHHSIVSVQFPIYFLSWLDQSYSVIPNIVMKRKNPFSSLYFQAIIWRWYLHRNQISVDCTAVLKVTAKLYLCVCLCEMINESTVHWGSDGQGPEGSDFAVTSSSWTLNSSACQTHTCTKHTPLNSFPLHFWRQMKC